MKLYRAWLGALLLCAASAAAAQQFAGRDVTMIVNYTAGGPTDIEARLVARYLPKYLKGVRAIIVRNMGGAGGLIGVNQLGTSSDNDNLNIGFFTWDPVDQLIQNPNLRVRYNDLKFVAGFQQVSLVYVRKDTPPGIKRPGDIIKAPLIRLGVLSPTNHATVRNRLALDLLGVRYDVIPGYRGLRDIEMALQRGDVNMANTSLPSWYTDIKPSLADTGIVMPVFQYDAELPGGKLGRSPELPDVPSFTEVYRAAKGASAVPDGEQWQSLRLLDRIMDSMYRTVFMPPNAPPAAVEEMRGAFKRMAADPEFVAAYKRIVRTAPRILVGAKGDAIIQELGNVPPQRVKFLRKYLNQGT